MSAQEWAGVIGLAVTWAIAAVVLILALTDDTWRPR